MTVATNDSGPGQCKSLLGTDDMDNALAFIFQSEIRQPKSLDVILQRDALGAGVCLLDKGSGAFKKLSRGRRNILERQSGT